MAFNFSSDFNALTFSTPPAFLLELAGTCDSLGGSYQILPSPVVLIAPFGFTDNSHLTRHQVAHRLDSGM